MPEGLSPSEIGKEIAGAPGPGGKEPEEEEPREREENEEKGAAAEGTGRDRMIIVIEAILLAVVWPNTGSGPTSWSRSTPG